MGEDLLNNLDDEQLITRKSVEDITTLSRSTLYRLVASSKFPRPVPISPNRVAWRVNDVRDWLHNRR